MSSTATDLADFKLFIDGKSVDAVSGRTFVSQDPYQGTVLGADRRWRSG